MAFLTQRVIRQGIKPCNMNVLMSAAKTIYGSGISRSMSTSIFSRATGSVLGNYSAKVGDWPLGWERALPSSNKLEKLRLIEISILTLGVGGLPLIFFYLTVNAALLR